MPLSNIINQTTLGKIYIDSRLHGEILTLPFKTCLSCITNSSQKRTSEAFKRTIILVVAVLAMTPTAILAAIGVAIKGIDLSWRFNQFIHKGPMIGYSLPLPMELGSRLGDRLVAYIHAKLLAVKYNIPLYFQTFAGAELFAFYRTEQTTYQHPLYFKKVVTFKAGDSIEKMMERINKTASTLYTLPYFPLSQVETRGPYCSYPHYDVDWKTHQTKVQELLTVTASHKVISIPKNSFSIALHIRTGGTYDTKDTSTMLPTKLPSLNYYIGELRSILSDQTIHNDQPIFIHLFTDDNEPQALIDNLKQQVPQSNITWSYNEDSDLASDIANMTRFECLIRPDSNLSGILTKTTTFSFQVSPTHFVVDRAWKQITLDQVTLLSSDGTKKEKKTNYTFPVIKRCFLPSLFYKWFHRYFVGVDSHEPVDSQAKPC